MSSEVKYTQPSTTALLHAVKICTTEDKPLMLDYWMDSLPKENDEPSTVLIGVRENSEKLLVKSEDEYTSPISKIYQIETEYLIVTENSLYIVSKSIPTKRIS